MNDFWKSYDITHAEYGADYRCYPLYGTVHLMELAISLAFIVGAALWYRRSSARTRRRILVGVTALLLLDEAALLLGMALTGQWNWSYLPLHLCNINVFVCLYNTITDRNWCKEELYALCIPGAMLALLCPSWLDVPSWWTLINLHSVSIHALSGCGCAIVPGRRVWYTIAIEIFCDTEKLYADHYTAGYSGHHAPARPRPHGGGGRMRRTQPPVRLRRGDPDRRPPGCM